MSILPLVVEDVGDNAIINAFIASPLETWKTESGSAVVTARIDRWTKESSDTGPFVKANQQMVNTLHERGCKLTMKIVQPTGLGRLQVSPPAAMTCVSGPGATSQLDLNGSLFDLQFKEGLSGIGTDDTVMFIVQDVTKEI